MMTHMTQIDECAEGITHKQDWRNEIWTRYAFLPKHNGVGKIILRQSSISSPHGSPLKGCCFD